MWAEVYKEEVSRDFSYDSSWLTIFVSLKMWEVLFLHMENVLHPEISFTFLMQTFIMQWF
jgi:hypothetical protein